MNQLYGKQWEDREGAIFDYHKNFTNNFLFWCRKTESLTEKQWKHGIKTLENDCRIAEREGEAKYLKPPNYAVFVEKCQLPFNSKMYQDFPRSQLIEDQTAKDKRREMGIQECGKLLAMFD